MQNYVEEIKKLIKYNSGLSKSKLKRKEATNILN
jgi:hypothetical protein